MERKVSFEEMLDKYQINEKVYVKKKYCDHQGNIGGGLNWQLNSFYLGNISVGISRNSCISWEEMRERYYF